MNTVLMTLKFLLLFICFSLCKEIFGHSPTHCESLSTPAKHLFTLEEFTGLPLFAENRDICISEGGETGTPLDIRTRVKSSHGSFPKQSSYSARRKAALHNTPYYTKGPLNEQRISVLIQRRRFDFFCFGSARVFRVFDDYFTEGFLLRPRVISVSPRSNIT